MILIIHAWLTALAMTAGCVPAVSAEAQERPGGRQPTVLLEAVTPEQMTDFLNQAGYRSAVQGSGQNRRISAEFFPPAVGTVSFSNCGNAGCSLICFAYDFGTDTGVRVDWANSWNVEKPFVSAALENDGRVIMRMWVHLFGGVTPGHLKAMAARFVDTVNSVSEFRPK
jgi:hypothetical protein